MDLESIKMGIFLAWKLSIWAIETLCFVCFILDISINQWPGSPATKVKCWLITNPYTVPQCWVSPVKPTPYQLLFSSWAGNSISCSALVCDISVSCYSEVGVPWCDNLNSFLQCDTSDNINMTLYNGVYVQLKCDSLYV